MLSILCLATNFILSFAICPKFTCDGSLEPNVCVRYDVGHDFKLNSKGCQAGTSCSAISASMWADNILSTESTYLPSQTLLCETDINSAYTTTGTWTAMSCGTKLPNKGFKNGQTVVACNIDEECVLADGTISQCMCILKTDGTGICEASTSNEQVYGGYWTDCGSGSVIDDRDTAVYWVFYMMYWEYQQSTVPCMSLFVEPTIFNDLFNAYVGAVKVSVGVLGMLILG
jgi:hypothetical protein